MCKKTNNCVKCNQENATYFVDSYIQYCENCKLILNLGTFDILSDSHKKVEFEVEEEEEDYAI